MAEKIFAALHGSFHPGKVSRPTTYYFSVGQTKKTVTLAPGFCRVEEGRTTDSADCVCKMSEELFLKIWNEGYRPGMKDFLSGAIKSNDPQRLRDFLQAFGKEAGP